jgi:hypothetical protein
MGGRGQGQRRVGEQRVANDIGEEGNVGEKLRNQRVVARPALTRRLLRRRLRLLYHRCAHSRTVGAGGRVATPTRAAARCSRADTRGTCATARPRPRLPPLMITSHTNMRIVRLPRFTDCFTQTNHAHNINLRTVVENSEPPRTTRNRT